MMTKRVCPLSKSAATLGRSRLLTHKEKKSEKIPFFGNCRIFFLSSSQKLWPNPILRKGKYILCGGEDKQRGKRGKIFREEIYFFAEEKNTEREKEENVCRSKLFLRKRQKRRRNRRKFKKETVTKAGRRTKKPTNKQGRIDLLSQ